MKKMLIILLVMFPVAAYAIVLPTAPISSIPNEVGKGSVNPYLSFSQNENINLSNGLVTLNPKGLSMQLGTLSLDASPAYHPNRGMDGTDEFVFSTFHALAYPSVDKAVYTLGIQNYNPGECPAGGLHPEGIDVKEGEEFPCEWRLFPLGDLGFIRVARFQQVSTAAFRINDDKWQFGINGIVGALGAEIEVGDQGDTSTVYMLIKSDGTPVFLTTAEKETGFRKNYKILGEHRFGHVSINADDGVVWKYLVSHRHRMIRDRLVVQDSEGVRYTFASNEGFRAAGNYRSDASGGSVAWESRIETRKCYKILGLFGDCDAHLNFPGWRAKPFFLQKVEDPYGNEIRIASEMRDGQRVSVIVTGKAIVEISEGMDRTIVESRLHPGAAARRWVYDLDAGKNITAITDPDGNVTRYRYLAGGQRQTVMAGQVFGSSDADAAIRVTNPLGGVTQFDSYFGSALRGTVVTEMSGTIGNKHQKTVFVAPTTTTIFDMDGGTTYYDFDIREGARVLNEKRMAVDGKLIRERYDWQTNDENSAIYGAARITNELDGQSYVVENKYDRDGRLIESRDGSGEVVGYGYYCDDIPEDRRIVSDRIKTVRRVKNRIDAGGGAAEDVIEIDVKPFFPVQCEKQEIYQRLADLNIDIPLSDILNGFEDVKRQLNNYGSNVERDLIHDMIISKIDALIDALNNDAILSVAGGALSVDDFVARYNADAMKNQRPAIGGVEDIDQLSELVLAAGAMAGLLTDKINAVAGQFYSNVAGDPDYDIPYDDLYRLTNDTMRDILSLSPVWPDLPYMIGQISMRVNGGGAVPLRSYIYELKPGGMISLGDIVRGGPLAMEVDEKGMHAAYLYHYCDIADAVTPSINQMIAGMGGNVAVENPCGSLDPWRKDQVDQQLVTAVVRGKKPAEMFDWAKSFVNFFNNFQAAADNNAKAQQIIGYLGNPDSKIDAELYAYDLGRDELLFRADTNFNGQFYRYSDGGDLRQINFINGSYIKIEPNYVAGDATVVQETYDVTRDQTLRRVQHINGLGQVVRAEGPGSEASTFAYGPDKKVASETASGETTRYGYDRLGRLASVMYPGGGVIQVGYGRERRAALGGFEPVVSVGTYSYNGAAAVVTYRDFNGRIVEIGLVGGAERLSYRYRYDTFGNLIQTEGPDGSGAKYLLDAYSRINAIVNPDGSSLNVTAYDDSFNRPLQINFSKEGFDDIQLNLAYDSKGRVTSASYPSHPAGGLTFTYDEILGTLAGFPFPKIGTGRITSVADSNGTTDFYYTPDGFSHAISRRINGMSDAHFGGMGGVGAARIFVKDGFSNTKGIMYGGMSPIIVNYEADAAGRLSRVFKGLSWLPGGDEIASYSYDGSGRASAVSYANSVSTHFAYRSDGRLKAIRISCDGKDLSLETYGYDNRGNRAQITYLDGSSVVYEYTLLGYLKSASYYRSREMMPYYVQTYTYDAFGNRLTYGDGARTINYAYDGNQRLTHYDAGKTHVSFEYDRWGNVSREEEQYNGEPVLRKELMYDQKGNLVTVIVNNAKGGYTKEINYRYDYKGRREVKEIGGGETTFYIYDKEGGLLSEWKQKGAAAGAHYDHIYAAGMPIATFIDGQEVRYTHCDDMGTPRWTTDRAGNIIEANRYDPFGNTSMHLGNAFSSRRFQGAIFDEETGYYYMNGNYYDSRTGRFISKSRAGGGGSFASSNPLGDRSIIRLMNEPPPEKTPFIGVTGGDRFLENIAAAAKEGTDDFGGAGYVCVEGDVSGNLGILIFDTDYSTNVRGCIDRTTPFGTVGTAMGGQLMGEAIGELKPQILDGLLKDVAWKMGLMTGAGVGIIVGFAANPIAGVIAAGAIAVTGAIFYALIGNWTEFKAFFGFVDYVYMDHPPGGFAGTSLRAGSANRVLIDPEQYKALTGLANLGNDSLGVISGLAEFGLIPAFESPLGEVEPFGLRANIAQPVIPYRFNGAFNGGTLLGQIF